jgi:thymidylate synthase
MFLDMTLNQRSNDYIMAGYINKIQYVALQMMIASHLGYKVGKFCHYVQNLHIYDRHIEAAKEILERDPLEQQPTLELKSGLDFYSITLEDFKISNIKGIQKIKSELEIAI